MTGLSPSRWLAAAVGLALALAPAPPLRAQAHVPVRSASADFVRPATPPETLPAPLPTMLAGLRAPAIAAHVAFLASPGLEGRGLGARGLDAAAEYVATQLLLAGAAPLRLQAPSGGDTAAPTAGAATAAYFHSVPVREIRSPGGHVVVETRRGDAVESRTFAGGVDALLPELPPRSFAAPVVFAGYGIRETAPARDDYRALDVKDKLVLVLDGVPAGPEWQAPPLADRYASTRGRTRHRAKQELAASLGARALLVIDAQALAAHLAAGGKAPPTFFAPFDHDAATVPVVRLSPAAGDALLAPAGLTTASAVGGRPQLLPGATATVRVFGEERMVASRNVIGVIQGADPRLSGEAVVMGAHIDHLGRVGDLIYPGADDNASGVAALLEIAKAMAESPTQPSRTVVFAFWTGEEEGHFGSDHYVRHPAWPLDRTVAYLNLDMIGHPWTPEGLRQLVADTRLERGEEFLALATPGNFVELGVAESSSELPPLLVRAARGTGVAMHLDRTDGTSGGSDYRAFARRGVPFVRFFGNFFQGYHEPADTAATLDAGQVLTMARVALASTWLIATK